MNIITKKAFTYDNDGALRTFAFNTVYVVDSTLGGALVTAGLASEYTGTVAKPYGTKSITANGSVNVAEYATASVSVPNPSTGTLTVTANGEANVKDYAKVSVETTVVKVTYNANGGTGSVDPVYAVNGDEVELSDGTGLTAPSEKEFAGWATTNSAEEPDVESPLTVTANVTLYAVYVAESAE